MIQKAVIIGHDNYGAREIFTAIVDAHPDIQFFLIITKGLYYRKSIIQSILKMMREASIMFCSRRFLEMAKYRMKGNTLLSNAKRREIPFTMTRDINSEPAHDVIHLFAPDLIISTFTMNVFKQPTIDLANVAAIGCHPSILPNYRGLEVFFWALANGETSSGVSVFYLDEKIDAGKVIMQERFDISVDETVESLYTKLTAISARLLITTVEKFKRDEEFQVFSSAGRGSYFPMPTREAYRRFKASARKWC